MYIDPFILGVITTLGVECMALVVTAIIRTIKEKDDE